MTEEEYLKLAAKFARHLLLTKGTIEVSSAEGCNLLALLYEGMGYHDDAPQVPLDVIVKYVQSQMPSDEEVKKWEEWLETGK